MKKFITIALLLLAANALVALDLDLALQLGPRTASGKIQDIYGGGLVFFPSAKLNVWQGLGVGLGWELGYKKEAEIGLFKESSVLKVGGVEAFAAYELQAGAFTPYARLGIGSYSCKQEVESQFVPDVNETKMAVSLGAGVKYMLKKLFLGLELKYVPLKVQPLTEKVDLSGLRLLLGAGYRIGL